MYNTSVQQKLQSRTAAREFKNGTARVHLLREKCKQRIQEARRKRFDGARNTKPTDNTVLINDILQKEVSEFDSDIVLEDAVLRELREEMSEWYFKQQEEEDDYFNKLVENNIVCCPMCQKSCLDQCADQLIICDCGAKFRYNRSLSDLDWEIKNVINIHNGVCEENPNFFIEPQIRSLHTICERCNYFYTFV